MLESEEDRKEALRTLNQRMRGDDMDDKNPNEYLRLNDEDNSLTRQDLDTIHQMIDAWKVGRWVVFTIIGFGTIATSLYGAWGIFTNGK